MVLSLTVLCVGSLFVAVGLFGYLAMGSQVSTIVFLDLPSTSPAVPIIQFAYCLAIILSFPLTIYPGLSFPLISGSYSNHRVCHLWY